MKKRYQATIYLLQKGIDARQVYSQRVFRCWWFAFGYILINMVGTGEIVDTGYVTFETEITEICE